MKRAALLINCSAKEAQTIHEQAELQHRTVSSYMLNIVWRTLELEEKIFAEFKRLQSLKTSRPPGPRTTILLRCSVEEAKRIRAAAKRRQTTINGYVLHTLGRSWKVADGFREPPEQI